MTSLFLWCLGMYGNQKSIKGEKNESLIGRLEHSFEFENKISYLL